jgi:hypothetical protein
MVQRWNDADRGKPKDSEKNLSQCNFVYHKSHTDCPGRELGASAVTAVGVTARDLKAMY